MSEDKAQVERVARAMCLYEHGDMPPEWQEIAWPDWCDAARCAIAAMSHPSEPAPERGEVEALIERLNEWVADFPHDRGTTYSVMHPVTLMVEAASTIASLSAEVERLRDAET